MSAAPSKVLYVHHGSGQGGAAVSLLHLLAHLDRTRYEPIVAVDPRRPRAIEFFSEHGVETVSCALAPFAHTTSTWTWHTPRGLIKLLAWWTVGRRRTERALDAVIERVRPAVVHLNGLSLLPFARVAAHRGIPVVQHVREPVNAGVFGVRKRWLEALASREVAELIYICKDNADRLRGVQAPGSVIYNPVDLGRFLKLDRHACRKELGIADAAAVAFFPAGANAAAKGLGPFLQALDLLARRGRPVQALIPGQNVPFIDAVERYYAACDVVVAPFIVPHFSRAVIEAGAARRPVVASRIGGITEVVVDGVTGLLAGAGNADELADKIVDVLDHADAASAMADAGLVQATQHYDATVHARSVMAVYDRVLAR